MKNMLKYVAEEFFIWLTAIVVDEGDNGGGDQTGENIQEGEAQHCRIKNVSGREKTQYCWSANLEMSDNRYSQI